MSPLAYRTRLAEEDISVPGQERLGVRIGLFAALFSTKNFHSILGEVSIGGDDWHAVEHGRGDDKPIGGIVMMPW